MVTITELANKYNNAKGTKHAEKHGYTVIYDELFGDWEYSHFNLLEIGLLYPPDPFNSMRLWYEYFKNAKLYGFDIDDTQKYVEHYKFQDRVKTFKVDQGVRNDLIKCMDEIGSEMHVIIDDASHIPRCQQISLGCLFPHLKSGGYYIIEDLHCIGISPGDYMGTYQWRDVSVGDVDSPRFFMREYYKTNKINAIHMQQEEVNYLKQNIEWCRHYCADKMVVIRKK